MDIKNQQYLEESINDYLSTLKIKGENFKYLVTNSKNVTKAGANLELGFSCFALKIKFILNSKDLTSNTKKEWADYINSFQDNIEPFPDSSYIDKNFLNEHKKFNLEKATKNQLKKLFNTTLRKNFLLNDEKLYTYISAESKQAISTISEIGYYPKKKYTSFPQTKSQIYNYLDSFDWSNPWSAGAQFSSICLFTQTQLENNEKTIKELSSYIKTKLDHETGFYHTKKNISDNVLINGAMKVITGLDWINEEIHYPNKIIDYILNTKITNEACDLVDLVYVLFKSLEYSDYRYDEIIEFMSSVESVLFQNFQTKEGSFSYSKNKSQKYYYGLVVTKEKQFADLHGTLLLLWAYTLILETKKLNKRDWKIIKP